ncbi:Gfo/Idh/MocA family oxidoreductase [Aestuariicoccus sp. MJ-SS9]|uniref:Gfo/Idh/MocA family protein n=1 Tax=Aestuariicoccus sp. MJ-SS9 TaxID=3079855 RepID=UPI00290D07C6|nr:Gfo/Idh/MocA family oxidoreductase [Aestuariicoccus sp. MJ-SS9]MDU8909815.1 Gfo/Idh/MocA family oxidoreductase [Aestuariicoccus sp. MJ-SS9]
MAPALPLCVIGGGSIGFRHMSVALAAPQIDLTAVVEPQEARRAELESLGFPVVSGVEDVPARTRAAVIATPTPDHLASGLAALGRGWAVLVEKPVTATLDEAETLCRAAESAGLPLLTGHHRRCHPFVAAARDRLPDLGTLVAVQGLWSLRKHDSYYDVPWRRAPGAGPILTNLSHEIDLLRLFMGEIASITAQTANAARGLAIEDTAALTLGFASGALGTFLISDAGASPWSFEAASGENPEIGQTGQDPVRFIGTKASLCFPSLDLWHEATDWRTAQTRTPGPKLPRVDPILEQMLRFARVAGGAADDLLATGRDGLATLAATLATLDAAASGGTVHVGPVTECA